MRLLLMLAGFGALIGLAAPAQADPNGDFLAALNNSGITYHNGPDAMCSHRRQGRHHIIRRRFSRGCRYLARCRHDRYFLTRSRSSVRASSARSSRDRKSVV